MLTQKLAAAVAYVEKLCGGTIPTPIPDLLRAAVLMLAAHLYENREATTADTFASIPFGFDDMIAPYRAWEF